MIRIRQGRVTKILTQQPDVIDIIVTVEETEQKAVNYTRLTGPVQVGDVVILNTTAVHKNLGTGGSHFVIANISNHSVDTDEAGHIMKLRYTPGQVKVLSVEEDDSPYADTMRQTTSLNGMPVVVATLHSMLPAVAAALRQQSDGRIKVAYVMTDGAALPIAFSRMVRELKDKGMIQSTITCGHAFGGDYEAVNVYSGLLAAQAVAKADVAIVAMGPGIVGTGSKYGYTGLEQGQVVNAVHTLNGRAVAVPRISFADPRERHHGLSHHTRTALGNVALANCTVTIPLMETDKNNLVAKQIQDSGISSRHTVVQVDADTVIHALMDAGIKVTTMGRTVAEDREFFLAAGAAGIYAARLLQKG